MMSIGCSISWNMFHDVLKDVMTCDGVGDAGVEFRWVEFGNCNMQQIIEMLRGFIVINMNVWRCNV